MTMTERDANEVLKLAARADKRTIAKGDIEFWQLALTGITYAEAAAAVIEHYATSTDYVMPKHVRDLVEDRRATNRRAEAVMGDGPHCGRPSCYCTHTAPCDHGWISTEAGEVHCTTCHPGRRQEPRENRKQWMARLQEQDARWERKKNRADA